MEKGRIREVTITQSGQVIGKYVPDGSDTLRDFKAVIPTDGMATIVTHLSDNGVSVEIQNDEQNNWFYVLLSSGLPILLFIGFWIFIMRQMQAGGNRALSFGKSRAKLSTNQQKKVTFEDVAGVEEAKEELQEIIEFLREPRSSRSWVGEFPRVCFCWALRARGRRFWRGRSQAKPVFLFFTISGSDFVEMFVGVGASRVRDLFEQGKRMRPASSLLTRSMQSEDTAEPGWAGGHDEREQTLKSVAGGDGWIRVQRGGHPHCSNQPSGCPGSRTSEAGALRSTSHCLSTDIRGREGILKVHTRRTPLADDVKLSVLARGTPGFSGAQLANLVNEAALNAARFGPPGRHHGRL